MSKVYHCREIARGRAEGEVLISSDQILFYHSDFEKGIIREKGHALDGVATRGMMLLFPGGKGSSSVQMDGLYNLEKHHAAPLAFIVTDPDPVLVSCAIVMEIPMADRVEEAFYREVKNGDRIRLDTEKGTVEIL